MKSILRCMMKGHSEKRNKEDVSITDSIYTKHKKAHQYAMDMLKHEIHQGAEGLAHNLNSLNIRGAA